LTKSVLSAKQKYIELEKNLHIYKGIKSFSHDQRWFSVSNINNDDITNKMYIYTKAKKKVRVDWSDLMAGIRGLPTFGYLVRGELILRWKSNNGWKQTIGSVCPPPLI